MSFTLNMTEDVLDVLKVSTVFLKIQLLKCVAREFYSAPLHLLNEMVFRF
jgi:hypothetical protein